MFQIKFVGKIKTRILSPTTFYSENPTVYETMWKNVGQPDLPQRQYNKVHAFFILSN